MTSANDDLFRPTLAATHDTSNFSLPWNTRTLLYLAFFGGMFCGPLLGALNFRRLGQHEPSRWALPLVLILGVIIGIAPGVLMGSGLLENTPDNRSGIRLAHSALAVAVALGFARLQRSRMRVAYNSDIPMGKLFVPGLVTLVASWLATVVLSTIGLLTFGAPIGATPNGPEESDPSAVSPPTITRPWTPDEKYDLGPPDLESLEGRKDR